jgi:hypothetical protein
MLLIRQRCIRLNIEHHVEGASPSKREITRYAASSSRGKAVSMPLRIETWRLSRQRTLQGTAASGHTDFRFSSEAISRHRTCDGFVQMQAAEPWAGFCSALSSSLARRLKHTCSHSGALHSSITASSGQEQDRTPTRPGAALCCRALCSTQSGLARPLCRMIGSSETGQALTKPWDFAGVGEAKPKTFIQGS